MMNSQGKDRKDAHIPAKFLAGRGRALKELASKPLRAEEVEKRRRLQELILRGSVPLNETGKVPGGLSQEKWPKRPNQTGRQYNRRPDPIWTSYRSDECSINSYGSESSVGTSSLSNSTGVPTPPKPKTPPQSDAPSVWNKSQSDITSAWNNPQNDVTSAWNKSRSDVASVWNNPQSDVASAWNNPQSDATSAWNKPESDVASVWNKPQSDVASAWNNPQSDATSAWNKPESDVASAWNKPQSDVASAWNKPQSDVANVWNKPQSDAPSVWNKPEGDVASVWNEMDSPLNNNWFDLSNRRAFELPPRFRNRPPKQDQRKVNQYDFGSNQKHKTAIDEDLGKPAGGPASTRNQDNHQQLAKKTEGHSKGPRVTDSNPWSDWEKSVVVHGSLSEQDIEELAVIEDNDDIHDVFVNQYLNAMQEEQMNQKPKEVLQLTPRKIQQISKLKSTTQADTANPPPGTIPEPPKKLDRWGGTELKNTNGPVGWGDMDDGGGNWYEDGVSAWSTTNSTPGWT